MSGLIYLSDAYFLNSERQKSLDNLFKAKALNKKSDLVIDIEERINIINKN